MLRIACLAAVLAACLGIAGCASTGGGGGGRGGYETQPTGQTLPTPSPATEVGYPSQPHNQTETSR